MNRIKDLSIAVVLAGSTIAATSGVVFASEKGGEGRQEGAPGPAPKMSVQEITTQLTESGARRILEVEHKREDDRPVYEVKYVDADGQTREVYLDANSGRKLESGQEDDED